MQTSKYGILRCSVVRVVAVACVLGATAEVSLMVNAQTKQESKEAIDAIETAWKARQTRFKAVHLRWVATKAYVKGGISDNYPRDSTTAAGEHPDRDTVFDVPVELSLEGNKARYSYSGKQWHMKEGRFNAVKFETTYDGNLTKECYPERAEKETHPLGSVLAKGRFSSARSANLRPVVLFFRPLEGEFQGVDLREFSLVNTKSRVHDTICLEIQQRSQGSVWHLWIDPSRDHVVVKQLIVDRGVPSHQAVIRYRRDSELGWVPCGWDIYMIVSSGKTYQSERVIVSALKVDEHFSRDHFNLEFPIGSYVWDELAGRAWIVRADGSKRFLTRAEQRIPYAELLAAENDTGMSRGFSGWVKFCIALIGAGCLGWLGWRLFRPNRYSKPS